GTPDRARRQPARGAHAPASGKGPRTHAGPRSRPARRRPGPGPGGPPPPPGPRARGGRRHRRADRGRRTGGDSGAVEAKVRPAAVTALLGLVLTLVAGAFD